jgi:hypothetical protein
MLHTTTSPTKKRTNTPDTTATIRTMPWPSPAPPPLNQQRLLRKSHSHNHNNAMALTQPSTVVPTKAAHKSQSQPPNKNSAFPNRPSPIIKHTDESEQRLNHINGPQKKPQTRTDQSPQPQKPQQYYKLVPHNQPPSIHARQSRTAAHTSQNDL